MKILRHLRRKRRWKLRSAARFRRQVPCYFAPEAVVPRGAAASAPAEPEDAEPEEEPPLEPFDLYKVLGLKRTEKGVMGGRSRCFASYHARAVALQPERFRSDNEASGDWLKLRKLGLAFLVLSNDGRRDVYDRLGYEGLRKSEACHETSAFELDALEVFDYFFDACNIFTGVEDGELKEYLLLSADRDDEGFEDVEIDADDEELEAGMRHLDDAPTRVVLDDAPPPRPPAAAGPALMAAVRPSERGHPGSDAWDVIAKTFGKEPGDSSGDGSSSSSDSELDTTTFMPQRKYKPPKARRR